MKRDTAVALVLALLALLAIGIAAATLDDPVSGGGDGVGSGSGGGIGDGSGQEQSTPTGDATGSVPLGDGKRIVLEAPSPCVNWLDRPLVKAAWALVILAIAAAAAYRSKVPELGLAVLGPLGVLSYVTYLVLTACGTFRIEIGGSSLNFGGASETSNNSSGGSMGQAADAVASQPSLLLGIVLVVLILAAVVLLIVATGDTGETAEEAEEPDPEPEPVNVGAVGRAAGAAADRIAGEADAENEVYRAWTEMTEYLAVEGPESSTPAEFAEAAIDAGMAPDDVRELTALFEEVRYGTEEATEDRESRAIAALRRIEAAYAEGEE